jgi:hypothetical protein
VVGREPKPTAASGKIYTAAQISASCMIVNCHQRVGNSWVAGSKSFAAAGFKINRFASG